MNENNLIQNCTDSQAESCFQKPLRLGILYQEESGRGLTHPFFVLILDAFKQRAEEMGCEITFINNHIAGNDMDYAEYCRMSHLDGVCLVCADFTAPKVKALVQAGLPCLTVDHLFKRVPAVLSDNETGMRKLVDYAVSCGHRRIAFVHGHNNSVVTRTRIQQFKNTMAIHGLPVPEEYVRESEYHNISLTRRIVRELLRMEDRPTCIMLPDDIAYLGAQDAARENGLRIPDDISFAGYDGIPITQALRPRLTTIRQDSPQMGRLAAEHLIRVVKDPKTASKLPVILPVELVEGGTIGKR
jgi:DNA-binding LacI/PurR family transcriptional regulator